MGGLQGFGPVEVEADEPVFHSDWERRAARLTIGVMLAGHLSGRFRHAIERMDPAWYLVSPYYEHWLTATATGLVEADVLTQQELDDRLGAPFAVARPVRAHRLAEPGESLSEHRFVVGDRVRLREWHPLGHTRAPRYAQGRARHRGPARRRVLGAGCRVPLRPPTERTDLLGAIRGVGTVGRSGRPGPRGRLGELLGG